MGLLIGILIAIIIKLLVTIGVIHNMAKWVWLYWSLGAVVIMQEIRLLCSNDAIGNNLTSWQNSIIIKFYHYCYY